MTRKSDASAFVRRYDFEGDLVDSYYEGNSREKAMDKLIEVVEFFANDAAGRKGWASRTNKVRYSTEARRLKRLADELRDKRDRFDARQVSIDGGTYTIVLGYKGG